MFVITRAIEGVTLNGKEYLLDKNNEVLKFGTHGTAVDYLEKILDPDEDAADLKAMIDCIEEDEPNVLDRLMNDIAPNRHKEEDEGAWCDECDGYVVNCKHDDKGKQCSKS